MPNSVSASSRNSINEVNDEEHERLPGSFGDLMKISAKDPNIDNIGCIPIELIKKEGFLGLKILKENGGQEPKKQHSNHNLFAILCIGFLIFYKEDITKAKKVRSFLL